MTEIQNMVPSGIWSPVEKSECAHAMVTVGKDGGVRITSDLSPLNKYIIPDRYLLPRIEELFLKLRGMSHFSKIDLHEGCYYIELEDESKRYTATITLLGLMAYNRLPMGLKDAASVFQKSVSYNCQSRCKRCWTRRTTLSNTQWTRSTGAVRLAHSG